MKTGKLVSIVLTLAMLLSVLPMSAMAWGGEGENKDQTAEIKVLFGKDGANGTITLTTKTDNSATLEAAGLANSYSGMTLTAKRWYEKDTNDSPTLNYESPYDDVSGTLPSAAIKNIFKFGTADFERPETGNNTAVISVKVVDGTDETATYTLQGDTEKKEMTATPDDDGTKGTPSQLVWEAFSATTHFSVKDDVTTGDSYAILPVGSKIVAGPQSMTVNKKLKLDNLGDVDGLVSAYRECVKYDGPGDDDPVTPATSVEVLLKAGAQLIVGTREVQLLKDLTITLAGGTGFSLDDDFALFSVNSALNEEKVSGNSVAEAILNNVIVPILKSIEGSTAADNVTLTFTFSDAETSSKEVLTGTTEGTTITTTGEDVITLGKSSDGNTVPIASGSTVKVGTTTEASKETSVTEDTTTTTTKTEVTTSEYTVNSAQHVYEITTTTTTTKTVGSDVQDPTVDVKKTAITTTVADSVTNSDASDKPSDYVNVAEVLVAAVEDSNNTSNVKIESIAEMVIALQQTPKTQGTPNTALAEAIAAVGSNGKVVEVKPIATVTPADGDPFTHEVSNAELAGTNASFTFTIKDNAWAGMSASDLTVTHYYDAYTDANGGYHPAGHEDLTIGTDYTFDSSNGTITLTLNHFSSLAITANSTSSGTCVAKMQGSFSDSFTLRLLVTTDLTNVTADSFSLYRAYDDLTLERVTDRTAYNNAIQSVFAVEYLANNAYSEFGGTLYSGNTIGYKNALGDGWLITIKVFGPYLNTPLTLSMKDSNNNSVAITDYSYTDNASNTYGNSGTNQYTFLDYLKVMKAYYGPNGTNPNSEKSEIYSNLCNGIQTFEAGSRTFRSSTATN